MEKALVEVEKRLTESVEPGVVLPIPKRPAMLELTLEVETKEPMVRLPMVEEERKESTKRPMVAKKEVEVA